MRQLRVALALLATTMALVLAVPAGAAAQQACAFGNFIGSEAEPYEIKEPKCFGPSEVVQVQASNSSDYALTAKGEVYARGDGSSGQLGQGNDQPSNEWLHVPVPCTVASIGQARNEGVAICTTHKVYAWGQNTYYNLCTKAGVNTLTSPVEVPNLAPYKIVAESGGGAHTIWLTAEGRVLVCGNKPSAGVGENGKAPLATPTTVIESGVAEVSGSGAVCARFSSGAVDCWGSNERGQACVGSSEEYVWTPTPVSLPGPATKIATGGDTVGNGSSGFVVGGELYSCGDNDEGQLGNGTETSTSVPMPTGHDYVSIGFAGKIGFGITSGGELEGFGEGAFGMLGNGRKGNFPNPVPIQSGVAAISSVAQASLTIH